MKSVLQKYLSFTLVLLANPLLLLAQDKAEKEKDLTVIDTRQFVVNFFRDSRTCNVDIKVIYKNKINKKKEKNYLIKIEHEVSVDSIELIEPLNFDFFREKFKAIIGKFCYNNLIVSKSSMNEIFLWIYSVKDVGITVPLSGKLIINPKIMVITDVELDREYERRVDTIVISEAKIKPLTQLRDTLINRINIELDLSKINLKESIVNNNQVLTSINDLEIKNGIDKKDNYKNLLAALQKSNDMIQLNNKYFNMPIQFYSPIDIYIDSLNRSIQKKNNLGIKNNINRLEVILDSTRNRLLKDNNVYITDSLYLTQFKITQGSKIRSIVLDINYDSLKIKNRFSYFYGFNYNEIKRKSFELQKLLDDIDSVQMQLNRLNIFTIKKISLQFERGFLERIQVWVPNSEGRDIIFENVFAIGFSSIRNFRDFTDIKLFARNSSKTGNDAPHIFLSDVFSNYDNLLQNYTRDYSPADTAINLENMPGNGAVIELRREKYVNLFDTKFYTDLVGANENSPNGLVQIEVSRRFNVNTFRKALFGRFDRGWLNSITLYGSFNKLEDKQKYLPLRNQNVLFNGAVTSPSYATNLDFRRYENYSLGIEPNIYLFDSPDNKFTFYADLCARYGHTPLQDRLRKVDNGQVEITDSLINLQGHSISLYPRISFELFAERRMGFKLSYQYNYTWLFSNNQFKQIMSYEKSDLINLPIETKARKSHMIEFFLKVETSDDMSGRLFLRGRFFLQHGDVNTFFSQIQLGYAYNLVFKK